MFFICRIVVRNVTPYNDNMNVSKVVQQSEFDKTKVRFKTRKIYLSVKYAMLQREIKYTAKSLQVLLLSMKSC